ncbi:hypothetical protein D3C71_1919720 [compost metagenome]
MAHQGAAVRPCEGLALGIADQGAILTAHRQDQHLKLAACEALADGIKLAGIGAVGQQDQGAGRVLGG